MKNCALLFSLLFFSYVVNAQTRWDGGGDGTSWNNPANWLPDGVPATGVNIVLDNSIVTASYSVVLPNGAVTVSVNSLIINPTGANNVTLILPSSNTATLGLQVTGSGDALILNQGAIIRNSSGASSGSGISVSGTFRINNGARYIHNTGRANASIVSQLSTAAGTEYGVFEFDVPVSSYTASLSGRIYGTLIFSAAANGGTVTYVGSGGTQLNIRGDLQLKSNVVLNLSMSAACVILGNYNQATASTFNLQSTGNSNRVAIAGDLQIGGTITETGTGFPVLELNGAVLQHITVSGSILNSIDFYINNSAGVILASNLSLPYRYTIKLGNIFLGNFDLTTPLINQVGPAGQTTNHIVTNGTGSVIMPSVNSAIFPVGPDASHYNPVDITNGVNAQFAIRVSNGISPGFTGVPFPAVVNRTWTINTSPEPGMAASMSLGFYAGDWLNGFNPASTVDLGKFITGWNAVKTGLPVSTPPTGPQYETAFTGMGSGYNGSFIIGNAAFGLPVGFFITTSVQKRNRDAIISWSVNDCSEVKDFEVQHSVNGAGFNTIKTLLPVSNLLNYNYAHNALATGRNLYRIKVNYTDHSIGYSNIVAVVDNSKQILLQAITPNPVQGQTRLYIDAGFAAVIQLELTDMRGRTVKKWALHVTEGISANEINLLELVPGIYQLTGYLSGCRLNTVSFIKL